MSGLRKRGFAAMNQEQQRAIASKGGRAAHRKGTAHQFSSEEARKAGYLGGKVVSANREHMAAIGRKGGQRAGRASDAQRNAQTLDRHLLDAEVSAPPQPKEYSQQAGAAPPAVLPHWRDASTESSPIEEEHEREQAHDEQNTAHVLSTRHEADDVNSTASASPRKN